MKSATGSDDAPFSTLPLRGLREDPAAPLSRAAWPARIPAIRQVLDAGLTPGPITVLVGENGSGTSALVEAVAQAYGLDPEGGTSDAVLGGVRRDGSAVAECLPPIRGAGAARSGVLLRAEAMSGPFTYLESVSPHGARLHRMSHGEAFLEYRQRSMPRFPVLWILDEPEAALSLPSCPALVRLLHQLAGNGSQILLSDGAQQTYGEGGRRALSP